MAPSLAESWTVSADQRTYEFKLREGLKILHDKVREVAVAGPYRVRFHLHEPWPDFMTFYGSIVSGAGWVVPKKYVEQVGSDGFKKAPVGLGPYKFVSHAPGVELVMEAFEGHWRKVPSVKRLVFRTILEPNTRLAALKSGEVDIAYLDFLDQWDPKSPWADKRVRLAANYALGEATVNYLRAAGIRLQMRPMKRATFLKAWETKKLKGPVCTSALYGNAASRMSEVIPSDGTYAYGGYPAIDALFKRQTLETDPKKREALLHKIQQLVHERVRIGPIFEYIWPSAIGPRVAARSQRGVGSQNGWPFVTRFRLSKNIGA